MDQKIPFGPGETPTPVLSPSPCEASKTGGTARIVCEGGQERVTIAGCRRSCPGTRTTVRA